MDFFSGIKHGFLKKTDNNVTYFTIPDFDRTGLVRHAFSSRLGGVSEGPFKSLCFSISRENNLDHFRENLRRLCNAAGVQYDRLTAVNYEHGDNFYVLNAADNGKGISLYNDIPKCDALILESNDVAAVTMHADCVPLFFLDRKNGCCGIAHAGWRGVVKRFPEKLVNYFFRKINTGTEDLLVGIGPHIMTCCFEVGADVRDIFVSEFGQESVIRRDGSYFADMQYSIIKQFEDAGVKSYNITVADMCTSCNEDLFFSHRRDHGITGAMASIIQFSDV